MEGGKIKPVRISVAIDNRSNIAGTWQLTWKLIDPYGNTVAEIEGDPPQIALEPRQTFLWYEFENLLQADLTLGGRYLLAISCLSLLPDPHGGTIEEGKTHFTVLEPLHLSVTYEVTPDQIGPVGQARARNVIRLTVAGAKSAGDNTPAAVGRMSLSTENEIFDSTHASVTVTLSDIVNSVGRPVPPGAQLVAQVAYGTLSGGQAVPNGNPQLKIYETDTNGRIAFTYTPEGTALTSGQHSLVVIEFHPYLPDADPNDDLNEWYGPLMGKVTIRLAGMEVQQ